MLKKLIFALVVVFFLSSLKSAHASILINEIMYAPASGSDHEWVEILNNGSDPVDLTGFRFFHGDSNSGPLSLKNGESAILPPSEYAIIAKSLPDYGWLDFSGTLFSASTLSLPDSGDNTYIAISDRNKNILDSVIYDPSLGGSKDSGESLGLASGSWQATSPTPGQDNIVAVTQASTASSEDQGENGLTSLPVKSDSSKAALMQKTKVEIAGKTFGFAGLPFSFSVSTFGENGEQVYFGKYFLNFGDGDSKEVRIAGRGDFSHTYFYPGEYSLSVFYYKNYYSNDPDASSKLTIKIIPISISATLVKDSESSFTELSNNSAYDADISGWILANNGKSFSLPSGTIIGPKKIMIIPSEITGFSVGDENNISLTAPGGRVVFTSAGNIPIAPSSGGISNSASKMSPSDFSTSEPSAEVFQNYLPASAVLEDNTVQGENDGSRTFLFMLPIFLFFVGACAGAVYFIRRKKITTETGSDFEILDE